LSGGGLCDELITRPEESYRLCCVVVCDLETSRIGAPYIYDISHLRVKQHFIATIFITAAPFRLPFHCNIMKCNVISYFYAFYLGVIANL